MIPNKIVVALALSALLTGTGAWGQTQDWTSANYILPGCRAYVANSIPLDQLANSTTCRATVATLAYVDRELGFCVPDSVTDAQLMRVVITYIDSIPGRMHESFRKLSLEAFRKTWPCPR